MNAIAGRQLAGQLGRLGLRVVQQRRRRRTANNQWVLGSRILGLPYSSSSTPRARLRARRRRRNGNGGGRSGAGLNGLDTRGVNTTVTQPVTYGHTMRRVTAPMNRPESGNEELAVVTNGPVDGAYFGMSFSINPAESSTFARLATLSTQYQRYTFKQIQLTYTPFKGTSQTGEIAITMAPDPTHDVPTNMTEFMGLFGAIRGPVNLPLSYSVPASLFSKALNQYMMKCPLTPSPADDSVINSVGRFYVAVQNVTGGAMMAIGRLAISYDLVLNDPVTQPEGPSLSGEVDLAGALAGVSIDDALVTGYDDGQRGIRPLWWNEALQMWSVRSRYRNMLVAAGETGVPSIFTLTCYQDDPAGVVLAPVTFYDVPGMVSTRSIYVYWLPQNARFRITSNQNLPVIRFTILPCVHDPAGF